MTCDNNYYKELARLEDERDVALAQATLAREAYQKFQSYIDWKELREQLADERKHRLALQDTLNTWQKQIRTLQDKVEAAFRAGYHCSWNKEIGGYCFDPAMCPGDPDGAYKAWLATLQVGP